MSATYLLWYIFIPHKHFRKEEETYMGLETSIMENLQQRLDHLSRLTWLICIDFREMWIDTFYVGYPRMTKLHYRGLFYSAQNIVKKEPGRARQNCLATAITNLTKPGAHNKVDLFTPTRIKKNSSRQDASKIGNISRTSFWFMVGLWQV